MTRPIPAVGRMRLHILAPDTTTSRGYLSADGASMSHSKAVDGSALTFTANHLETQLATTPAMLNDAFAVVEVYEGSTWTPKGTPYALAPGVGQVVSSAEGSAKEQSPVSVGALQALLSECIVLPSNVDDTSPSMRYACGLEGNRYIGWQSAGYTETLHPGFWNDVAVYDPSGLPKANQPEGWDPNAATADWVWRDATVSEGSLTLFRIGEFTLTDRTVVKFISSADEEHKVYLDGPNMGGVIIDNTFNETGYTYKNEWKKRLDAGTYFVAAEMTTVISAGGDGNDSLRFACGTVDTAGKIATLLLSTSASVRTHRQPKTSERPGMSPMLVLRRLVQDNIDLGVTGGSLLLGGATFGDLLDSAGVVPAPDDCREWVWPLGTSLASVAVDMSEEVDLDLSPGFAWGCWLDRGVDRSTTVALVPGGNPPTATMNLLELGWESDPKGPTRYLTLSQDGYATYKGTTAEATHRPQFGFLESGASASIARAKANARAAVRQNGNGARRYMHARAMPVTGFIPGTSFTVADLISGRDYRNVTKTLEVTDIGWEQNEGSAECVLSLTEG